MGVGTRHPGGKQYKSVRNSKPDSAEGFQRRFTPKDGRFMASRSKLAGVAEDISDEENYDEENYDEEEVGGGRAGDDDDARRGAAVLMRHRGGRDRGEGADAATKEGAAVLAHAAKGLWGTLYGGTVATKPSARYYRCVVLRTSRDGTYSVKYADGTKRSCVHKRCFKVPEDVHRDDVADWIARNGRRLMARKPKGFSKSRMHEMATPTVLRKDRKEKMRFASEEDERECTFGKPRKGKRGKDKFGDETKENADFLVRMEAKETARRAEIERKKKEAKNMLRKSRATTKKWTDEDGERFLNRLAEAERKKKMKYKKLQKELRPAFNITERKVYNEETGKIETVPVVHEPPDHEGFLRKLAEHEQQSKAKRAALLNATAMATPGRRAQPSPAQFSSTYEF